MQELQTPDGIDHRHLEGADRATLNKLPFGLFLLGALLLLGSVFGLFGAEARQTHDGDGAILTIDAPTRVRTGQIYEMVFTLQAERSIEELVLLVEPQVWRGVTINTFMPSAREPRFEDGSFAFRYGPLAAGERFLVKIAAQVDPDHPPSANEGRIAVQDGARELVAARYRMEVLP